MSKDQNFRELENQFHNAMLEIYHKALYICNHNHHVFLRMVVEHGGVQAAKRLLHSLLQSGFTALWECNCLNLTMENLVLRPQFSVLFTEEERQIARNRLQEYGYRFDRDGK